MDDLSFLDKYAQPKPVTTDYDGFIEESASKHGVDPDLIRLQMGTESAFKPKARSPKGASGLMQLMPGTARNLGVKNIYDPKENIEGGVKYMRQLLDMFGGDVNLALAGYNAGEGAVQKYGNKIPPYKETQNYVKKIGGNYKGTGYHPSNLSFLDKYADTPAVDVPDVATDTGLSFLDKYVGDPEDTGTIYGMTDADINGGTATSPTFSTPQPVRTDPVPETPETLQAQVASTFDENSPKSMTLLTTGNPANNFILSMSEAKRLTRVNTPNGIVLVNAKKLGIKPSEAKDYVKKNGFAKDSGFVIDMGNNTGDGQPAVAAVDPNTGREVFAAVTPTPESAQSQAQQNQAMFPGTVQVPTDTDEVAAMRAETPLDPNTIATAEPYQGGAYQGQLPDGSQLGIGGGRVPVQQKLAGQKRVAQKPVVQQPASSVFVDPKTPTKGQFGADTGVISDENYDEQGNVTTEAQAEPKTSFKRRLLFRDKPDDVSNKEWFIQNLIPEIVTETKADAQDVEKALRDNLVHDKGTPLADITKDQFYDFVMTPEFAEKITATKDNRLRYDEARKRADADFEERRKTVTADNEADRNIAEFEQRMAADISAGLIDQDKADKAIAKIKKDVEDWRKDKGFLGIGNEEDWANWMSMIAPGGTSDEIARVSESAGPIAARTTPRKTSKEFFDQSYKDTVAQYGSIQNAMNARREFKKRFENSPMTYLMKSGEAAVGGAMKVPFQGAASALKAIAIGSEAIERATGTGAADPSAEKKYSWQLAKDMESLAEGVKVDPDFKGGNAEMFGNVAGQVAIQAALAGATGGALTPALFGAAMGASKEYEDAGKFRDKDGNPISPWKRLGASLVGGLIEAPDYFIFKGMLKGGNVLTESRILQNFKATIERGLIAKGVIAPVAEKAATDATSGLFAELIAKGGWKGTAAKLGQAGASKGKLGLAEGVQEGTTQPLNDLAAYMIFDPSPERWAKATTPTKQNFVEGVAGFFGGLVGASIADLAARVEGMSPEAVEQSKEMLATVKDELPPETVAVAKQALSKKLQPIIDDPPSGGDKEQNGRKVKPKVTLEPVEDIAKSDKVDISVKEYPVADPPEYTHSNYKEQGGKIIQATPDEFLSLARDLKMDDEVRDNVDDLKRTMESGRKVDPATIYLKDGEIVGHDGRHRAIAAQELGIKDFPILVLDESHKPITAKSLKELNLSKQAKPQPAKPIDISPVRERAKAKAAEKFGVKGEAVEAEVSKTTQLPEIKENHLRELSDFSPVLYREVSPDKAVELLSGNSTDDKPYFANTPNLAMGQGLNKGVVIELDSKGLQGQVNTSKPAWESAYANGEAEFIGKYNKSYLENVKNVTISKEGMPKAKRLYSALQNPKYGFSQTQNKDGSVTFVRQAQPKAEAVKEPQKMRRVWEVPRSEIGLDLNSPFGVTLVDSNGEALGNITTSKEGVDVRQPKRFKNLKDGQNKIDDTHRKFIVEAIRQGEKVPAEVLADYPDLKARAERYAKESEKNEQEFAKAQAARADRTAKLATRKAEKATNLEAAKAKVAEKFGVKGEVVDAQTDANETVKDYKEGDITGADLGTLHHGSLNERKGDFKTAKADGNIKTQLLGDMPIVGTVFNATFLAKDPKYAANYSQGDESKVTQHTLSPDAKVLSLPDIISEEVLSSKGLGRSDFSSLPRPTKPFPFQSDFDAWAMGRLNADRKRNGKAPFSPEEFQQKVGGEFDPSNKDYDFQGIASKYLPEYIQSKGYDAVAMGREIAVLNPKVIQSAQPKAEAVKEPWEMGKREFYDRYENDDVIGDAGKRQWDDSDARWQELLNAKQSGLLNTPRSSVLPRLDANKGNTNQAIYHRSVIKNALRDGKAVPQEVLADYPDLAKLATRKAEKATNLEAAKAKVAERKKHASEVNLLETAKADAEYKRQRLEREAAVEARKNERANTILGRRKRRADEASTLPIDKASSDNKLDAKTPQSTRAAQDNSESGTSGDKGSGARVRKESVGEIDDTRRNRSTETDKRADSERLAEGNRGGQESADNTPDARRDAGTGEDARPGLQATETQREVAITDFGEKIGGARKDMWSGRGLTVADLDGMTAREKGKLVKKDQIWTKPDYQAVSDRFEAASVADPNGHAYAIKLLYDGIAQPDVNWTDTEWETYIKAVAGVRDEMAKRLENPAAGWYDGLRDALLGDDIARGGYLNRSSEGYTKLRVLGGTKFINRIPKSEYSLRSSIRKANEISFPSKRELWMNKFAVVPAEKLGVNKGSKKIDGEYVTRYFVDFSGNKVGWVQIADFATDPEAQDFKNSLKGKAVLVAARSSMFGTGNYKIFDNESDAIAHAKELYGKKPKRTSENEPVRPQLKGINREGEDYRKGKHATPEQFTETFGFRGVEFGNWLNDADRQQSLDHAFDGLMDLAGVLKVDPKALSLNGNLGLAFGARGKGGKNAGLAHYEPSRVVINLTKMSGAGSLAHEWGHAVDDYFGSLAAKAQYRTDPHKGWASGLARIDGLRPEMQDAWRKVISTILQREASQEETVEMARAEVKKQKSIWDSWMRRIFSGNQTLIQAAIDVPTSLIEQGVTLQQEVLAEVYHAISKEKFKPSRKDWQSFDQLTSQVARAQIDLQKALAGEMVKKLPSNYKTHAANIDKLFRSKEYWSTTLEMFARAFESYVQDRTGGKSQYLVHGAKAETQIDKDEKGNELPYNPYPTGEERDFINAAFDNFVATLEQETTESGNVALRKVAEPTDIADIEALGKGDFKELFNDIKSDVKSDANGANILDLGTNKTIELVRTAFAYMYDTPLEGTAIPGGMYLDPSQTNDFRDALQGIMDAASENGVESKGVDTLIKNLDKAAKDGDVRVIGFDETLPHETIHQQSRRGAIDKELSQRYSDDGLGDDPVFNKFHKKLIEIQGKASLAVAREEALAYLSSGDYARFGLTEAEATEIVARLIESYANKNGVDALKSFEGTQAYEAVENYYRKIESRETSNDSRSGVSGERETGPDTAQAERAENDTGERGETSKAKDLTNDRRPGKSGLPFDEKEAREADAKGRKVAAISRIIGVEIYYDPQSNTETAVKAEQLTGRVGVQKAIADALTGKPSAEGMKVVYTEFARLNALYDHFNDNGQEAEAIAIATELADLANAIQERQLATGQEAQIARTFDVLSPDIALLMAQRRIINKRGEGAKLTAEETAATIDAAKQLSKIEAQLEETRRKLRNSEAARRRLESDKEPRKRAATSQEKLLKEYQEQKTDLFAQLEKLFPDSPLFNGKEAALRSAWRFAEPSKRPQIAKDAPGVFWHGSDNADLRGGTTGLHVGTYEAAKQALEARIGVPANGEWDGTTAYGDTLLMGKTRLLELEKQGIFKRSGHNMYAPDEDYYPRDQKERATYSNGEAVPLDAYPIIEPVRISGSMTNSRYSPRGDWQANGLMKRALNKGNARNGFYYTNEGEDAGSISAVVPDETHIERLWKDVGRELDGATALRSIAAEPLDPLKQEVLTKWATGQILEGLPYEALIKTLEQFGISQTEAQQIHSDAVDVIKPAREPRTAEAKEKTQIRNEHYREASDFNNPTKKIDAALKARERQLTKQIETLKKEIETREKEVTEKTSVTSETIEALKAERDGLKEQRDTIFGDKEISDKKKLDNAIKAAEKSVKDLETKIEKSDLETKKKDGVTSPELTKLRDQQKALRKELQGMRNAAKPAQLSGLAQDAQEDAKYKDDPKLIEVIDYLTNVNTAKAGRSLNQLINGIREANPEMSISQAEALAGRAQQAVTDLRAKRKRAADKAKNISEEARIEINKLTVQKRNASRRMSDHLKQLGRGTEWAMHRFNNLMRAAFVNNYVTQLFNAVQSTVVATPTQMALDGITQMMLRAGVNIGENTEINLKDILLPEAYIFANNRQLAEQALAYFPEEYFRIHAGILGDIEIDKVAQADTAPTATKWLHTLLDKGDSATDFLSKISLSKVQEMYFRNAIIGSRFDQLIRAKSKGKETLESALKNGEFTNLVTEKDARRIADDALEVTFASEITDPIGKKLKSAYDVLDNFVPIFLNPVTYARFTYTTTKVMVANPLLFGAMDAKAAGGRGYNTKSVAKGTLAWGGVVVAYALTSALGGDDDRWDTLYVNGKDKPPLSIKRFFPLSAYFYVAHLIRQYKEGGTPPTKEDLLEGFMSLETEYYTYGPGLGLASSLKRLADGTGSGDEVGRAGARMMGNFFGGLLSVLKPAKLALNAIDEEEAVLRDDSDTAKEKFLAEISRSVPFIIRASDAPKKIDPVTDKPILQPWILGRAVGLNFVHPSFLSNKDSAATQWANRLFAYEGGSSQMSAEDRNAYFIKKRLKEAMRRGEIDLTTANEKAQQYLAKVLTPESMGRLQKELELSELQSKVKAGFSQPDDPKKAAKELRDLRVVWDKATDQEKEDIRKILSNKRNLSPEFIEEFNVTTTKQAKMNKLPDNLESTFDKLGINPPGFGDTLTPTKGGEKTKLTPEQKEKYERETIERIDKKVESLQSKPVYQNADDALRKKMVEGIIRKQRAEEAAETKKEIAPRKLTASRDLDTAIAPSEQIYYPRLTGPLSAKWKGQRPSENVIDERDNSPLSQFIGQISDDVDSIQQASFSGGTLAERREAKKALQEQIAESKYVLRQKTADPVQARKVLKALLRVKVR